MPERRNDACTHGRGVRISNAHARNRVARAPDETPITPSALPTRAVACVARPARERMQSVEEPRYAIWWISE